MCYPKPGPRCSNYARKTLIKAHINLTRIPLSSYSEYKSAEEAEHLAEIDYDATPGGQKELLREIKQIADDDDDDDDGDTDEFKARLEIGIRRRSAMMAALREKDRGDFHDGEEHFNSSALDTLPQSHLPLDKIREPWNVGGDPDELEDALVEESSRWMFSLNPHEQEAVRWYTSDGAHVMNNHIMGESQGEWFEKYNSEDIEDAIDDLDSAMDKYESPHPFLLYRGLQDHTLPKHLADSIYRAGGKESIAAYMKEKFPVGSTFVSPVNMSASLDPRVGLRFERYDYIMEIVTKKAFPVAVMSAWGVTEREMIVRRDVPLRVIGIYEDVTYVTQNMHWSNGETNARKVIVIQLQEDDSI